MSVELSIVIVNYNSGNLLVQSLKSILESGLSISYEIIIVDNHSNDSSLIEAKTLYPKLKFFELASNLGFARANNTGINNLDSKYVLLLNPDTVVEPGSLQKMIEFMDASLDIGITGAKLLNPDKSTQLSCRSFPSWINALYNRYSPLTFLFPKNKYSARYLYTDWDHDKPREVDWVSGACMMVRSDVFRKIGLLDEKFFMYCEDVDLCYRAKLSGWKVFYYPYSVVVHYIACGKKKVAIKSIIDHHRSMYRFYRKHYSKNRFFLDIIIFCGIIPSIALTVLYKKIIRLN
jgi:hypothetical protein